MFQKLLFFFPAFLLMSVGQASAQIGVSPSRLFFEGKPGETVSRTLTLSNSGSKPLEFTFSLKDWKRDSTGAKVYAAAGTFRHSNARYVKFNENTVVVAPGENKAVAIYMDIPQGNTDSIATNAMLFVTQASPEAQKTDHPGIGVQVVYEYAIQLFYNPYGIKTGDLEFTEFNYLSKASDAQTADRRLRIAYKNTGNVNKTAALSLEITNKETGEEIKLPIRDLAIMPNDEQVVYFNLPGQIGKGDYLVIAVLNSDTAGQQDQIKVAKKNIQIN